MKRFNLQYITLLAIFSVVFFAAAMLLPSGDDATPVEKEAETRYHVQVVVKSLGGSPDFWRVVAQGVKVAADEFHIAYELNGPDEEIEVDRQIEMVRAAIAKKPDALVLAASDVERLVPVCREARAAGIKLIMMDSNVNFDDYECFVATDNYTLGLKLGALLDEVLGEGERFGVMGHMENSFTGIERERGLLDGVADVDKKLAGVYWSDGLFDLALVKTQEMMAQNPDITCIVGLNESSALGVCYALDEMGLSGQITVVACDSSENQIKYMESGMIHGAVVQNPFNMGYFAMKAAADVLSGKKVEKTIHTDSVVIRRSDMRRTEYQKLLFPFTDF